MEYDFTWHKKMEVLTMNYDTDYPCKGAKSACESHKNKYADMTITGYKKLESSWSTWSSCDEEEVKEFLYQTGPLTISLNADPLQTYTYCILDLTSNKYPTNEINLYIKEKFVKKIKDKILIKN